MKRDFLQKGQVGIIAVLVSIVIFTLGMSVASRVVIDSRISSRAEEGARAQAAAESAMEIALSKENSTSDLADMADDGTVGTWEDADGLVGADYRVRAKPDLNEPYEVGALAEGEARTIWLVHLAEDPQENPLTATSYTKDFQIAYYGEDNARAEIALYYDDNLPNEEVKVWRQIYTGSGGNSVIIDPQNDAQRPPNFDPDTDRFYLVRIRMITGSAKEVKIIPDGDSGEPFPTQEFEIEANGWTNFEQNQIRRRNIVSRKVGDAPAIFDYVIANTGGSLVKN